MIEIDYTDNGSLIEKIVNLQRGITLKVKFDDSNEYKREHIGGYLKDQFPDFWIAVLSIKREINIFKIITNEEIEANIKFFTQCAIDYDNLATLLMNMFITKYKLEVNWDLPLITFNKLRKKQKDKLNGWKYIRHGQDFRIENIKTKQKIEASVVCGDQFGALSPLFFYEYILSTPQYRPLPVELYSDSHDGGRILDVMEKNGILKQIQNNWGFDCYVLSIKDTSHIKPYTFEETDKQSNTEEHFNLLKFLRLKK